MIDLAFVRANLPLVEEKLRSRGMDPGLALGDFAAIDSGRREAITRVETLKALRNRLTEEIAHLRRGGGDAATQTQQTRDLKTELESLELEAVEADARLQTMMQTLPNLPADGVPTGASEHDNVVEKRWGEPTRFDFAARSHWELGEALGILDFNRAAKTSGSRFVVHFGQGARLERALANFMLDLHTRQHGYTEVLPPFMVNSKSLFGTGQLPKFGEELFHCDDKGPFRTRQASGLRPLADPYGRSSGHESAPRRDARRSATPHLLLRLHALLSVRGWLVRKRRSRHGPPAPVSEGGAGQVSRGPEESAAEHEKLTRHAETILETLGLPYRRVLLCTGDMGFSAAKTYDLEVWLPGQQLYREISSCSNFESFQARRANIRYKAIGAKKAEFLHTLNGSGLAIGRTYLAILENYQQADGTIRIPEALVPYMNGETVIGVQNTFAKREAVKA